MLCKFITRETRGTCLQLEQLREGLCSGAKAPVAGTISTSTYQSPISVNIELYSKIVSKIYFGKNTRFQVFFFLSC